MTIKHRKTWGKKYIEKHVRVHIHYISYIYIYILWIIIFKKLLMSNGI